MHLGDAVRRGTSPRFLRDGDYLNETCPKAFLQPRVSVSRSGIPHPCRQLLLGDLLYYTLLVRELPSLLRRHFILLKETDSCVRNVSLRPEQIHWKIPSCPPFFTAAPSVASPAQPAVLHNISSAGVAVYSPPPDAPKSICQWTCRAPLPPARDEDSRKPTCPP
jgi:hypothetical protein